MVDAVQSFPWLFLVITVMSLLKPGSVQVIIVLGDLWGIVNIRTARSVVLSAKERPPTWRQRVRSAAAPGAYWCATSQRGSVVTPSNPRYPCLSTRSPEGGQDWRRARRIGAWGGKNG